MPVYNFICISNCNSNEFLIIPTTMPDYRLKVSALRSKYRKRYNPDDSLHKIFNSCHSYYLIDSKFCNSEEEAGDYASALYHAHHEKIKNSTVWNPFYIEYKLNDTWSIYKTPPGFKLSFS